jgi:hypothetical protein
MKNMMVLAVTALLIGCADPAFQQYIASRQAAIAAMPDGPTKAIAQERLDQQILADKQRQNQQAANAALAIAAGAAAGAQAYSAAQQRTYIVYPYPYYRPYWCGY